MEEGLIDELSMDQEGQEDTSPSLVSALVCGIFSFLFTIGCTYFALFSVAIGQGISFVNSIDNPYGKCEQTIPSKYLVSRNKLFPPDESIQSNEYDWMDGPIFQLESLLSTMSIKSPSDYFNIPAKNYIEALCYSLNTTKEEYIQSINKIVNGTLYGSPDNMFVNPAAFSAKLSSTLFKGSKFLIKHDSKKNTRGLNSIKRQLFTSGRAQSLSFLYPQVKLSVKLVNDTYSECNEENCETISYPNPSSLIFPNTLKISNGPPTVLSLVGFNDNFISFIDGKFSKGGFILRGMKPYVGNSYQYLFGAISAEDEEKICNYSNLICTNEKFCVKGRRYHYLGNGIYEDDNNNTLDLSYLPNGLDLAAFRRSTAGYCGFTLLPYDLFTRMESISESTFASDVFDFYIYKMSEISKSSFHVPIMKMNNLPVMVDSDDL